MNTNHTVDPEALVRQELEGGLHELEPVQFTAEHQLSDGPLHAVAWTYIGKPRAEAEFLGVRLHGALDPCGESPWCRTSPARESASALVYRLAGRAQPGRTECRLAARFRRATSRTVEAAPLIG